MPKIKQLSHHEAQKIAAGEVVERPANIVKELVENSIDAGATRISVFVEDGGKQLIRIVDNGCGMDKADAQKCFDRHATSKITRVDELELIDTFGFRGEALASIASVSQITLLTKEENDLEGTQVIIEANTITHMNTAACATGTDISVHNLFFNVPARKKFLKSTQTEWRAIQLLFNAFCFDYPHIHFTLFSEDKQIHNCPAVEEIKNRALQLFEPATHKHLLTLATSSDVSLAGVISDHQQYRYDRSGIYFFVNKRWVKNQHLSNAFVKGYANVIPQGRYPLGIIHITVPAHEVDINIHPRKEEVKFLHPRRVEQALQLAVKTALEENLSQHLKKDVTIKSVSTYSQQTRDFNPFNFDAFFSQKQQQNILSESHTSRDIFLSRAHPKLVEGSERFILQQVQDERGENQNKYVENFAQNHSDQLPFVLSLSKDTNTPFEVPNKSLMELQSDVNSSIDTHLDSSKINNSQINYRLIGQYNTTYLLVEKEDGLFLVDQHAAHERILYELFSQRFHEVATIQLLFPQIITLSTQDMDVIIPHLTVLIEHGILIEQCASDQLIVQSLPVHLKDQSITEIVKEVISWITESSSLDGDSFKKTINHKLQAQMACKAAVKAGDVLTQEKMEQLLRDLEKTANRFSCPHGRPTGWLLSLAEIEKKFRRRL
jgi:DNA mismatch repair protein MutL